MFGLRSHVAALICGAAILAGLISAAVLSRMEERRSVDLLHAEASIYLSLVEEAVRPLLLDERSAEGASDALQGLAQRFGQLESVRWLEVFDEDGRVVAHTHAARLGNLPLPEHALHVTRSLTTGLPAEISPGDGRSLVLFVPVLETRRKGPVIGVVELVVTAEASEADGARHWRTALATLLSAIAVGCLALLVALDVRVLRPIRRLAERARSVAGARETARGEASGDELESLHAAVSRCIEVLTGRAQTNEARYRDLLAALPHGVAEVDLSGRIVYANPALAEMHGYERGTELEGRYVWDLLAREMDRDELREHWGALIRDRPAPTPYRGTTATRDGCLREVKIDWTYQTGEGNELRGFIAIVTNITEQSEAEQQRRQSEDAFRAILEHMPVMLVASDSSGKLAVWNEECERVTGHSAKQMLGQSWATEAFYPEAETRESLHEAWKQRRGNYRDWESQVTCRDGGRRTIAWSSVSESTPIPGFASWAVGVEVTERVRAERALRASEEMLRSITDNTPDILMVLDVDGTIRFLNHPAPGLTRDEVIGSNALDYAPEHFRERARERFLRVATSGKAEQFDGELQSPDGRVTPYDVRISPIFENGKVVRLTASCTDVSERRRAEDRFRAHYKHFPLPTYTYQWNGEDFAFVDFNDAALEATDGLVPTFVGRGIRELYGDDPGILEDFRTCFTERRGLRRAFSHRFRTTGRVHELDVTYVFVPPDYVVLCAEHLDERKKAEEALRRNEQSLARAQQIAHVGNWDWNIVTNDLQWSDEIYRIFGLEPQEFGATYDAFLETVHPEDREMVKEAVEKTLRRDEPYSIIHRIVRRDGSESIVHEQAEVTFDDEGRPVRMLGTVQDVTRQQKVEQQLKAALEEKETLLREVHHRVKNNLQVVSSLLYLQSQKAQEPELKRSFEEMHRRVRSMALIHENLYASTDLGRVDLGRYLQMLVERLRDTLSGRPVRMEVQVDEISLNIQTAVLCGLIVNELVTNSVRHAFENGSGGEVRVELKRVSEGYGLRVRDDGRGLQPEVVDRSPSLGLRLVRSLVDQLEGRLEVGCGPGADFRITFAECD